MLITVEGPRKYSQVLAATSANIASFAAGTGYGWSSPVGLMIASNNTDETPLGQAFSTESNEYAWISSLLVIGALISPFMASFLADRIGRKWTLLTSSIFFIVSSIMFIFGYNVWILYIGRIVQGSGIGFVLTTMPLYVGEITSDNLRGSLGAFMSIFLSVCFLVYKSNFFIIAGGILYTYAIGAYTSYYILQYACLAVPIVFVAAFALMPESPYYLIAKGKTEDAIKSLQFLRNESHEKLQDEIKMIEDLTKRSEGKSSSILAIFKNKGDLKAFLICWGLISFQQFTGMHAVLLNSQIILDKANTGMDTGLASIAIAILQLVAGAVTPLIANRFGRKTILLVSMLFLTIGLIGLGAFFYVDEKGLDISYITWLPLVSLACYMFFSSVGIVPIPFTIIGELFSTEVKFTASAILAVNGAIISFAVARWYPAMQVLGIYFPFWLYAGLSGLSLIFIVTVVVETKGLSLKEIQDKLSAR